MAGGKRGMSARSLGPLENLQYGAVPFVFAKEFDTNAVVIVQNLPYKVRVLKAEVICTEANGGGTATLSDGTNNISAAITCAVLDTIAASGTLDVTYRDVAKGGQLKVTPANSAAGTIYVTCLKTES